MTYHRDAQNHGDEYDTVYHCNGSPHQVPESVGFGRRAIYGEAMNTIAKVALVAVIVLFTVLLLWGLWMQ
ncbi:MAG: hypothetical protein WBE89_10090 [Methyloceanibacter sp.]